MGVATTRAPTGLGPPELTKKLARNHIFEIFLGSNPPLPLKVITRVQSAFSPHFFVVVGMKNINATYNFYPPQPPFFVSQKGIVESCVYIVSVYYLYNA